MRELGDAELLRRSIEGRLLDVRTSMAAEVVSFNANTMTAIVRPGVRVQGVDPDSPPEVDTLDDVEARVMFPALGPFVIYHPLVAGDIGRLEFSEEDDSAFYEDGASAPVNPRVLKRHGGSAVFKPEGFRGDGALGAESSAHGFIGFLEGVGIQVRASELRLGGSDATDPVIRRSDLVSIFGSGVPSPSPDSGAALQTAWALAANSAGSTVVKAK